MLEFFVPGIIVAAVGLAAVYLFTKPGGRLRSWITATPNRIAGLGIFIVLLSLIGMGTYNEANFVFAQEFQQTPLPQGHPLLGTWRVDMPNGCFEEYTFLSNGKKLSQSGEERNESIFQISKKPSLQGYYRWVDKITRGNGKPDCGSTVTKVGHISVNLIWLDPNGKNFLLCEKEDRTSCFAKFHAK